MKKPSPSAMELNIKEVVSSLKKKPVKAPVTTSPEVPKLLEKLVHKNGLDEKNVTMEDRVE